MAVPRGLKVADYGGEPDVIQNAAGFPLFNSVKLHWSDPVLWTRGKGSPTDRSDACLYILIKDHGNYAEKNRICYVGLSTNPRRRFFNHPTAHDILSRPGKTLISFTFFDFIRGRDRIKRTKFALEQIEHLIIWALWPVAWLENDRKTFTLPGMGSSGGSAWQIANEGHRFNGRMPREIVYPWMLIKPGRDRSAKA